MPEGTETHTSVLVFTLPSSQIHVAIVLGCDLVKLGVKFSDTNIIKLISAFP